MKFVVAILLLICGLTNVSAAVELNGTVRSKSGNP
jgi:hypothetical protein